MSHNVLLHWHPMVGCDFHDEIMANPPFAPLMKNLPHIVAQFACGIVFKASWTTTVRCGIGWRIIHRGSDIGNLIPHLPIPPNACVLVAIAIAFSGSKSYFGPASVTANGKPVGAALAVYANPLQGNCSSLCITPTGVLVPTINSVKAGMTFGDILGGFMAMAFDWAVSFLLNKITGGIGNALGGALAKKLLGTALGKLGELALKNIISGTASGLIQLIVGSPLGHSVPQTSIVGGPAGTVSDGQYDVANWITGDTPPTNGTQAAGTQNGAVPSQGESAARSNALNQPAPANPPAAGQPGNDLGNQNVDTWR